MDNIKQKKKGTPVGYDYQLGMHLVLCQGPVDAVLALRWQDRLAWEGVVESGRVRIDQPFLFGEHEGGVNGRIDVLSGASSQGPNGYLAKRLGTVPAFRGVLSLVFRKFLWGRNPYIKPVAAKVSNVRKHFDDWMPTRAAIRLRWAVQGNSIYIAMDGSGSMAGAPWDNQKSAVATFIRGLKGAMNDVKVVVWSDVVHGTKSYTDMSDADYEALASWVESRSLPGGGTNYDIGVSEADTWFANTAPPTEEWDKGDPALDTGSESDVGATDGEREKRRILIFTTDGEPQPLSTADDAATTLASIEDAEVYCFNINLTDTTYTELLDNTASDGVPVISGDDADAMRDVFASAFKSWQDMNPAHIMRAVLIAPVSDGSGDTSEIGDTFAAAAETLFAEQFGISLLWKNPQSRAEFKELIERHIDGYAYIDRITGKWELKLIRDDYVEADLELFDPTNVVAWTNINRPMQSELPNQITLIYRKRLDGSDASVTVTNVAAVQEVGRVIPKKVTFEGIYDGELAAQVAMRELRSHSLPLLSGGLKLTALPATLNLGDAIKIKNADLGIPETVVRITEISDSDGRDNAVTVQFVEDRFAFDYDYAVASVADADRPDESTAVAPTDLFLEEMPYYEMVLRASQEEADAQLVKNADTGFWHAAAGKPADEHTGLLLAYRDDGETLWARGPSIPLAPVATLQESISAAADDTTVRVSYSTDLGDVRVGRLASINNEIVRVDAMAMDGADVLLTIGRGCLDTVPEAHALGSSIVFWDGATGSNSVLYVATESPEVRFLTKTPTDTLSLTLAPSSEVIFGSRAIRPYPPGNLKSAGSYWPAPAADPWVDPVGVTWAHRDRTAQTSASVTDFADGNIGPESGVSYHLSVYAVPGRADFFAIGPDFFGVVPDLFTGDPVLVLPEQAVGQARGAGFDFLATGVSADFFDLGPDFFALGDVFGFDGLPQFFGFVEMFDALNYPDFFATVIGRAVMAEFRVRAERDGYESWQTPATQVKVARAPDLEGETL
ncbi:VWA domain-containing protein [Maritimibacter sp. DP07]|uniref:VWA domain-containing protein n=1 Tax=Maritimibacter harenae TaxID=2606218 RepID=A0A845M8J6_9RHOB|nr:vWA domain-containing protein [Maritimibacter harenae]MZR14217.1 VWA domain-containing protein [Maritimibacter harenae]